MSQAKMLNLVLGSLDWQKTSGPAIIFVDEPFYSFLVRSGIEEIYQDVIPLPEEIETEYAACMFAATLFPIEIFRVEEDVIADDKEFIESHKTFLPPDIREKWDDLVLNEMVILSLHNSEKN